jgi:hypothetical protein
MEEITAHGYNSSITLRDTGIVIKPGLVGSIFKGGKIGSKKFIPYSSISGIEYRKGILVLREGVLQINTKGEVSSPNKDENKGDATNQNIIRFNSTLNKTFENISKEIQNRIN